MLKKLFDHSAVTSGRRFFTKGWIAYLLLIHKVKFKSTFWHHSIPTSFLRSSNYLGHWCYMLCQCGKSQECYDNAPNIGGAWHANVYPAYEVLVLHDVQMANLL